MRKSLLMVVTLLAAMPVHAALREASSPFVEQTAIVIRSSSLAGARQQAPSILRDSTLVSHRQIRKACHKFSHLPDTMLTYTPATGDCVTLDNFEAGLSTARLDFGLSNAQGKTSLEQLFQSSDLLVISPTPQGAPVTCDCAGGGNEAPSAYVQSGSPQSVQPSETIAEILFGATDADNDAMTPEFSYTQNGSPSAGLPAGLTQNCSSAPGLLECPVNGTAPQAPGIYVIQMTASDGLLSDSASARLEVLAVDKIFADGFE
jgi:hypothetical protein